MKMTSAIAGALALAFSMGSAQATEFVVNGDFTTLSNGVGQLTNNTLAAGWVNPLNGYNFVFASANAGSPGQYGGVALWDGSNGGLNSWNGLTSSGKGNFLALDGDFQTTAVTQNVTGLTIGKSYNLTFNYAFSQQTNFYGDTIQSLAVGIGSTSWDSGNVTLPSQGFSGWTSGGTSFTATSTSEVLSFLATGNLQVPPFALVSDVSITGVPELSTWAMMLAGFAGLGFVGYRRREKNSAVA
jgi:hypothetical protein